MSYRVMLDVPFQLALFVSELLAEHRRELGTRDGTRALTCWKQAVFALAWFRDRPDIRRLGQGFGISQATACRYKDEAVKVLAAKAPTLREALDKAVEQGLPYLILDGALVSSDRCADKKTSKKGEEIDTWYSGKAHEPAGNVQALAAPGGVPLWVSDVLPGSTHDLTAARELVLPEARPYLKDLPFLADSGYEGAGAGVHVPVKKPRRGELDPDTKNPQRASALPGRTRLRPDVPAVARPAARHGQPDDDRRHRQIRPRPRPRAIRAQDDQLKVAEKTSVTQKIAIVTGAARGIGVGTAIRLASEGMAVAVLDLNEADCAATVKEIENAGARTLAVGADVSKTDQVNAAVERVAAELGEPMVLVNNAEITRDALLSKMTDEQWDAVINVNLRGAFLMTRAAQKYRLFREFCDG